MVGEIWMELKGYLHEYERGKDLSQAGIGYAENQFKTASVGGNGAVGVEYIISPGTA